MANIEKDRVVTRKKSNGWTWLSAIAAFVILLLIFNHFDWWPFNGNTADVAEKKKGNKEVVATVEDDDDASSIASLKQYAKDLNDSIAILNQRLSQSDGPDIVPHVSKWSYRQPAKKSSTPTTSSRRKATWSGVTYQLPPMIVIPAPPVDTSTRLLGTEIVQKNGQTFLRKVYGKNQIVQQPTTTTGSY